MRAELRALDSPQLPKDPERPGHQLGLEKYEPPDPTSFRVSITAEIGPAERKRADVLDFIVCSPDALSGLRLPNAYVPPAPSGGESYAWGKGVLVMPEWTYEGLVTGVEDIISPATGNAGPPSRRS